MFVVPPPPDVLGILLFTVPIFVPKLNPVTAAVGRLLPFVLLGPILIIIEGFIEVPMGGTPPPPPTPFIFGVGTP